MVKVPGEHYSHGLWQLLFTQFILEVWDILILEPYSNRKHVQSFKNVSYKLLILSEMLFTSITRTIGMACFQRKEISHLQIAGTCLHLQTQTLVLQQSPLHSSHGNHSEIFLSRSTELHHCTAMHCKVYLYGIFLLWGNLSWQLLPSVVAL